jgi:hypothetical protein
MSAETSITHIRPRFSFTVPYQIDEVRTRIDELIQDSQELVVGSIIDNHITLDIPALHRHYWSPQLNFRIEPDYHNPNHTVVKGLIGPRPEVWTMFMFTYFSIGVLGTVGSIYGVTQWMLDEQNIIIYAMPLAAVIMLTAYKAGKYGEKLGSEQIETLKQFVRDALSMQKTEE